MGDPEVEVVVIPSRRDLESAGDAVYGKRVPGRRKGEMPPVDYDALEENAEEFADL